MTDKNKFDKNEMPDWDELQEVWQASPSIDMQKLARHARFVWWRMRLNFIAEVVLCLCGIGVFGFMLSYDSLANIVFSISGVVFSIIGLWSAVKIRQGAWGEPDDTAVSLLKLQIARAKSAIRYVKFNIYLSLPAVMLIVVGIWVVYEKHGSFLPADLSDDKYLYIAFFATACLFIVLFPFLTRNYVKRKEAMIYELEQRLVELNQVGEE